MISACGRARFNLYRAQSGYSRRRRAYRSRSPSEPLWKMGCHLGQGFAFFPAVDRRAITRPQRPGHVAKAASTPPHERAGQNLAGGAVSTYGDGATAQADGYSKSAHGRPFVKHQPFRTVCEITGLPMCNDYERHVRWTEYCKMTQILEVGIPCSKAKSICRRPTTSGSTTWRR